MPLDDTDRLILASVQNRARITFQDLAAECSISPSACLTRFRHLQGNGYIRGFAALLDPAKIELQTLLFIKVLLDRGVSNASEAFGAAAARMPEILECHLIAGRFDYLIKARIKDMNDYRSFLDRTLASMPAVREARTYFVLEEVKNELFRLPQLR
jgi:Lrp/AsnC family leucine-responsive transcriptional regulator